MVHHTTYMYEPASPDSRTDQIFMKKGDGVQLDCSSRGDDNNVRNVVFCISLVRPHEEKSEEKLNYPNLKILPESPDNIYEIALSSDNPGDENHDLAQNVAEYFTMNQQGSAKNCDGKNTSRHCDKCWCQAGCAFDYDSLGHCRNHPFGYGNMAESVNPCFFLRFVTEDYWDPKPSYQPDFLPEKHKDDQFQVGCTAKLNTSDIDYYAELLEMKENGIDSSPRPGLSLGSKVEHFIDKEELFSDIVHLVGLGKNAENFLDLTQNSRFPDINLMVKLKKISVELFDPRDTYKKANFERLSTKYLNHDHLFEFRKVVSFLNIMESLDGKAAAKLYQDVKKVKNYKELFELCTNLSNNNSHDDDDDQNHNRHCRKFDVDGFYYFEKHRSIKWFLDILEFTEYLEGGDGLLNATSDVENIMMLAEISPPRIDVGIFANDRALVEKLLNYENDLWMYVEVNEKLEEHISAKNKISVTHFPETGGFPKKYFPLVGYEETPLIAIKLNLQENKWSVLSKPQPT